MDDTGFEPVAFPRSKLGALPTELIVRLKYSNYVCVVTFDIVLCGYKYLKVFPIKSTHLST